MLEFLKSEMFLMGLVYVLYGTVLYILVTVVFPFIVVSSIRIIKKIREASFKELILSITIFQSLALIYIYIEKDTYAYNQCMDINQTKKIKEILGSDLELIKEANFSRNEIIELAKIKKRENKKDFCSKLLKE